MSPTPVIAIAPPRPVRSIGRVTSNADTTQLRVGAVQGDGNCGMRVSGTSHHQTALENLAGGREAESAHHSCTALLLPEPDNPYDPGAVAVYIVAGGQKTGVGYLPHDIAPLFKQALLDNAFSAGACDAVIVGGWHDKKGDGNFGVRLDAFLPFQLHPAALPDVNHHAPIASQPLKIAARPPVKSKSGVGMLLTLALIATVVGLAYFQFNIGR